MTAPGRRFVREMDTFRAELVTLKRRQAGTAVINTGQAAGELAAVEKSQMKIATSPLLRSSIEAERKVAFLPASRCFTTTGDRAFICLHVISTRRGVEL